MSADNIITLPVQRGDNLMHASISHSIKAELALSLPALELVGLYQVIESTLPNKSCRIVQFASAYQGEGVENIAFETAIAAATKLGKRVLFIDTSPVAKGGRSLLRESIRIPLGALLKSGGSLNDSMVVIKASNFVYSTLYGQGYMEGATLPDMETFRDFLATLRGLFDLIVIASPSILSDVLGTSLTKLTDGSVVVVEANRTRLPVVLQTRNAIEASGGRVIGSVLNKRHFYLPRWLYRML